MLPLDGPAALERHGRKSTVERAARYLAVKRPASTSNSNVASWKRAVI